MNLRFITSDCNCKNFQHNLIPIPNEGLYFYHKNDTDQVQAYLNFKYEVERGTVWFSNHLNNQHINNIFVNGISLRRIG